MCYFLLLYAVFAWFSLLLLRASVHGKNLSLCTLVLDSRFFHITEMVLSGGCGLYLLVDYNCWFWKWVLAEVVTWHRLTFVNGCHWSKLQYNMVRKLIFQVLQKYLPTMVIMNYFWWMVVVLYEKNYTRTLFGIYKRYYILCSRCSVCQWRHS